MIIKSVGQIVAKRPLPHIASRATVHEACQILDAFETGALVVLGDDQTLIGILSASDVIKTCICRNRDISKTGVTEIMTPNPYVAQATTAVSDALKIMVDGGFRHLPILDHTRTVGLLAMRDIPTEYRLMLERYMGYLGREPVAYIRRSSNTMTRLHQTAH